ncbi:MAG: SpoIIE family protein phosphatase, partial [Actinomycetota bacterium]|nr:SpoIIE family protein phosphatase [Actinomycetota bacterium]
DGRSSTEMIAAPGELALADAGMAALAEASRTIAAGGDLQATLDAVAEAAAQATGATLAVVWLRERDELVVRAVAAASGATAAELTGLRAPDGVSTGELLRMRLERVASVISLPLDAGNEELGRLDLVRDGAAFGAEAGHRAPLAADLAGLALRLCTDAVPVGDGKATVLEVAGDALAAASAEEHAGARIARLAVVVSAAESAFVWRPRFAGVEQVELVVDGAYGSLDPTPELSRLAAEATQHHSAVSIAELDGLGTIVTLRLGQPTLGALQLAFRRGSAPAEAELARLTSFAVRVAHALRSAERARDLGSELERSRALLELVSEAISRLSLSHTLETTLERLAELLGAGRVAVYLEEDARLTTAASRAIEGPHEAVAQALLELALGPLRGRGIVEIEDAAVDERLALVRSQVAASKMRSVIALPLLVADQPIGLLAIYPRRRQALTPNESALLPALAAQLAVVVQNARLHERATRLGEELETALAAERQAARQVKVLYEISRSFAHSLSLDATLDVLAKSIVSLLGVDAAVIRMPDERGLELVARAIHVDDERVDAAVRALLSRPQPLAPPELRELARRGEPLVLDPETARELGGSLMALAPFLERGSSVAIVPVVSSGELIATLTIVSLHPDRPVAGELAETARSITGQAALGIDNARLYAQQKAFADAMQRALLPREAPQLPGLELGDVYESSARVDVGGDVYDYLTLEDGRLAVVLGDVMGHGVEATAEMAMAKFVFRSLAREHPEPEAFLAAANDVVASEIEPGKFITMVQLVIDAEKGEVACASAGHPAPRLVLPDGTVEAIAARGLALGIEAPLTYERVTTDFPLGAAVVLYTDGVIEARGEGGEQFGLERFDELLATARELPAKEIAEATLVACREWSDEDLTDDLAVVVIKRSSA